MYYNVHQFIQIEVEGLSLHQNGGYRVVKMFDIYNIMQYISHYMCFKVNKDSFMSHEFHFLSGEDYYYAF